MIPFTIQEQLSHANHSLYLIEASAGTGKTYTIANLYLRHILSGKSVSQILVVTFTNAATDELRGRIREKLYTVLQNLERGKIPEDDFVCELLASMPDLAKSKAQLELAVRSMDEASIFTIHSFCQRALKEFAFLSGQSFNLEFNTDEDALLYPIAKDWWRRNIYEADTLTYQVAKTAWPEGVLAFYKQIKSFLSREVKITPELTESVDLLPLTAELHQAYRQSKASLHELLNTSKALLRAKGNSFYHKDNLEQVFNCMNAWLDDTDNPTPPDELIALTTSYLARKKNKSKQRLPEHEFFEIAENYWQQYQQQCQQILTALILDAITFFDEQGETLKIETQTLSFNDLLIQFNKALLSSSGEQLCEALQARYPVAMIDEFQDTDPVQYGIFSKLYVGQAQQTLYMIGDPKQAIYSFRGGDIYTYLQAKQDVINNGGTIYTLDTNWRSTPTMLKAVNTLFGAANNPFIYDEIEFYPVNTPTKEQKADHKTLTIEGKAVTPLNFWLSSDGKALKSGRVNPLSKTAAQQEIDTAVAHKIAELIQLGIEGKAKLADKNLQPKDIAVLVPSHYDAQRLRAQLSAFGVASVTAGKQTVFESHEAADLSLLLQAVLKPDDRDVLRQALASSLLAYNYVEIYTISNDDTDWIEWVDSFRRLHEQWQHEGFMSMFLSLLERLKLAESLVKQDGTDRIMTNLLQLGELLQQASKEQTGIDALITWFDQKRLNPSQNEDAELRLESDKALVKLVTLHASKGLEYGVVFLPYLWSLRVSSETDRPIIYHNEQHELIADTGSDQVQQHYILADRERLAEHTRLVYVALTRAVACCYIAWGNIGEHKKSCANNSALGYLLHGKQTADELKESKVASLDYAVSSEIEDDLRILIDQSDKTISVEHISTTVHDKHDTAKSSNVAINLQVNDFDRSLADHWRISSFSALSRNIHHNTPYSEQAITDPILNFPSGKRTGLYLHSLFEHLDFQGDINLQLESLNERLMPRYGLSFDDYHETSRQWVEHILQTSLSSDGLTLANISHKQRLSELAFHFSTGENKVSISELNQLLADQTKDYLQPLKSDDFHGLVNGVIDLVFEHKGKYYLADYKSNYLGHSLGHYHQDGMENEIHKRRYDLQYILYSLALHRFLENRMTDYDYEAHFGGVYYLFFRGMRESEDTGVFFTKPDLNWLKQIDQCFS